MKVNLLMDIDPNLFKQFYAMIGEPIPDTDEVIKVYGNGIPREVDLENLDKDLDGIKILLVSLIVMNEAKMAEELAKDEG